MKKLICSMGAVLIAVSSTSFAKNDTSDIPWSKTVSTSEIDDSIKVHLYKYPLDGDHALMVRCVEDETDVVFDTDFVSRYRSNIATFRLDDNKAFKLKMSASTNNQALFTSKPISFIRKMLKSDKLVFRYNDYKGGSHTVVYNITGLAEPLKELQEACHWK